MDETEIQTAVSKVKANIFSFNLATEEYATLVHAIADLDLPIDIPNRHIEHAAVLENEILKRSQENVQILTGAFPEIFFSKVKYELESALKRKVNVDLIFVETDPPNKDLKQLMEKYSNLKVLTLGAQYRDHARENVGHFMVSDGVRLRMEEIHPVKDFSINPEVKATASFCQPETAKTLQLAFAHIRELSSTL